MTKTFVQTAGLNQRTDWDIDWNEKITSRRTPIAVYFKPINGLAPIYCSCYAERDGYAVLKVPPMTEDGQWTDWFPVVGWSWVIVPEKFVYPQ